MEYTRQLIPASAQVKTKCARFLPGLLERSYIIIILCDHREEAFCLSLKCFVQVHVAMKVKFALEQPSSMGVGHELARSCTCYSS